MGTIRHSPAARRPLQGVTVNVLLLASLLLLALGIFGPLMTLEKFYVFRNTVTLATALRQLAVEGQWPLFAIIGAFSILLPLAKLALLFKIWNLEPERSPRHQRHLRWLAQYGKWSMLDVFVVAVLVVSVKLKAIAAVEVHYGVYAFAASVLLSMLATQWILYISRD